MSAQHRVAARGRCRAGSPLSRDGGMSQDRFATCGGADPVRARGARAESAHPPASIYRPIGVLFGRRLRPSSNAAAARAPVAVAEARDRRAQAARGARASRPTRPTRRSTAARVAASRISVRACHASWRARRACGPATARGVRRQPDPYTHTEDPDNTLHARMRGRGPGGRRLVCVRGDERGL